MRTPDPEDDSGPSPAGRLILALALGLLAGLAVQRVKAVHARRQGAGLAAVPERTARSGQRVQRWEAEGGRPLAPEDEDDDDADLLPDARSRGRGKPPDVIH
jgi:hypothetical protein